MAEDPPSRKGSGSGSAKGSGESLPRLTEVGTITPGSKRKVVPDYEELSPYYQRPSSAPAAGVDTARPFFSESSTRELERQHSDIPVTTHQADSPLPHVRGMPLTRGSVIRTYRKFPD